MFKIINKIGRIRKFKAGRSSTEKAIKAKTIFYNEKIKT